MYIFISLSIYIYIHMCITYIYKHIYIYVCTYVLQLYNVSEIRATTTRATRTYKTTISLAR